MPAMDGSLLSISDTVPTHYTRMLSIPYMHKGTHDTCKGLHGFTCTRPGLTTYACDLGLVTDCIAALTCVHAPLRTYLHPEMYSCRRGQRE